MNASGQWSSLARALEAAARFSADEGWNAVTVRRVAEEAGTTTWAVYSLFGSKQGLEEELHQAMFERLLELMRATPTTADPRADLLELRHAYRTWATGHPDRYAALTRFSGPHAAARSPEGLVAARAATTQLRQVIARCAVAEFENRGLLPDGDQAWHSVLAAIIDGYAG